jgi:hypothetical protein
MLATDADGLSWPFADIASRRLLRIGSLSVRYFNANTAPAAAPHAKAEAQAKAILLLLSIGILQMVCSNTLLPKDFAAHMMRKIAASGLARRCRKTFWSTFSRLFAYTKNGRKQAVGTIS